MFNNLKAMDLHGKVAIVTGASMGIGEAIARALAQAGCDVALAARSADRIDKLAAELRATHGVRAVPVPTDVTDTASVEAMIWRTEQVLGRVDILVNNAGLGAAGSVDVIPEDAYRYVFDVNVFGVMRGMQAAIPAMRRQGGGVIVNIGSVLSYLPLPQLGPSGASSTYAASKFALRAISLAARAELAAENIRVVTVYPGLTRSRFGQNVRRLPGQTPPETTQSHSPNGLYDRARRRIVIPAERVADRTLVAIRRNEREVFISWWDRLAAYWANRYPGTFDQAMQWAAPALGGVTASAPQVPPTSAASPVAEKTTNPNGWFLLGLTASIALLWTLGQRRKESQ
jgi:short-subunit dehydrogenase